MLPGLKFHDTHELGPAVEYPALQHDMPKILIWKSAKSFCRLWILRRACHADMAQNDWNANKDCDDVDYIMLKYGA